MRRLIYILLLVGFLRPGWAKLTSEQMQRLPEPASGNVDFNRDIKPILETSCVKCHGRGRDKGNFRIDSSQTLAKGGDSGPAIIPGKSADSLLIELVSGLDPDNVMPKKGTRLTTNQVSLLRAWIDQGGKWDAEISFAKIPARNLKPQRPTIALAGGQNSIDQILAGYYRDHHIPNAPLVSDAVFARRVFLDVIGLLPLPTELDAFIADRSADKRAALVRRLLGDNQHYAEHWLTFWNDALRNDYKGTGYIDGGRKQISAWLFTALVKNKPYDQFVSELVNPTEASAGFTRGIVWRGVVNASQVPAMQAAQNVSQVFMGANLKCASCHDSFVNDWTLADAYGLANIYSTDPLEIFQCDKPTGRKANFQFLFPELGSVASATNRSERLKQLAEIIVGKKNGRLTRTFVNRLWGRFIGRGLVEPLDDMEQPAWNADLLDWLAEDFASGGYDVKKIIERILTSEAYQRPVAVDQGAGKYFFQGPLVRRMSAEQFRDALGMTTGVWFSAPVGEFDFSCLQTNVGLSPGKLKGKWIWSVAEAAQKAPAERVYFHKRFELETVPKQARAVITCDNSYTLYVNGKKVGSGKDFAQPQSVDLKPHLKKGKNLIAIQAINHLPDNTLPPEGKTVPGTTANPAGLFFSVSLAGKADFGTDTTWTWSRTQTNGWESVSFDDSNWTAAFELGDAGMGPWNAEAALASALVVPSFQGNVRSAMVAADPLTTALGRPNREQVMTVRSSTATTLQALELTNGETLARLLKEGASKLLADKSISSATIVHEVYRRALGRNPTAKELELARELVGEPVREEGVQDLVWTVAMLPEFQLIY